MVRLFIALLLYSFPVILHAQGNFVDSLHETRTGGTSFLETSDYYYLITEQNAGSLNPQLHDYASQFVLNKYHKQTRQKLASVVIAGDTLQNDSIVLFEPWMKMKDDKIYLEFIKRKYVNSAIADLYYFKQYDTSFSLTIPEVCLSEQVLITSSTSGGFLPLEEGKCFFSYRTIDSIDGGTVNYMILDSLGHIIQVGEPGYVPVGFTGSTLKGFRGMYEMGNQQYIQAGDLIPGMMYNTSQKGWAVVDKDMNVLDTFYFKSGLTQSDTPQKTAVFPYSLVLPSGNLICGGSNPYGGLYQQFRAYPVLSKHTKASRYATESYIAFGPIDATDSSHSPYSSDHVVVYNPFNHLVYMSAITHTEHFGLECSASSILSYLEVICVDTNLNLQWRKFFKTQGACNYVHNQVLPYQKSGIWVSGISKETIYYGNDTDSKGWIYYIDENTPSDNPTAIAEATANEKILSIYPNPTTDELQITSEEVVLKEAQLFDISGRLLHTQSIHAPRTTLSLASYKSGVYLLRCYDNKGNTYVRRVLKQ